MWNRNVNGCCMGCGTDNRARPSLLALVLKRAPIANRGLGDQCSLCGNMEAFWPQNVEGTISTGLASGSTSREGAMNNLNESVLSNDIRTAIQVSTGISQHANESRNHRKNKNTEKLYHQTNTQNWPSINSTGRMDRGSNGEMARNGIYFPETSGDTSNKDQASGVVIEAVVKLGSVKKFRQMVMHPSLLGNS